MLNYVSAAFPFFPLFPSRPSLTLTPISFSGDLIEYPMFHPVVADLNNDGFIEVLGTFKRWSRNLVGASVDDMGLERLWARVEALALVPLPISTATIFRISSAMFFLLMNPQPYHLFGP